MYQVNIVFVFCRQSVLALPIIKVIVTALFSFTHREYLIKKDSRTLELYITVFYCFLVGFLFRLGRS